MKKILIFIMIVLFIFGMKHTVIKEYTHTNENAFSDIPSPSAEVEPSALNGSLTITAVGDCTLATDINAPSDGSFVSEVENNNYDYSYFFKNVKEYFETDDLTIVNFEGALSDAGARADKQFAFRGKPEYAEILSSSSVEAANLANNHAKDYGVQAFDDTKKILSDSDIIPFGWSDVYITIINGIKVGLIGTNALNSVGLENHVEVFDTLKAQNPDLIIASFHWGEERASSPSQKQINLAHSAIDNGADLVIGHHPHVLQGIEKYNGKYIVYSLGNFCFGGNKNPSDKDTMIFKQTFTFENGELLTDDNVSVLPCSISSTNSRNNYQPTPLTGEEYNRVMNKIIKRSESFEGIDNVSFIQ